MEEHDLPFKVDHVVEVRSNISGYRGAWFRCKIKAIRRRDGDTAYDLEYVDYPDEKVKSTKIYQKCSKKEAKRQLMVRPRFPEVYHASQLPDIKNISDLIVVVNDIWKVGDFVDWFTDGCFWCGRIKEILGKEMARIELLPPPAGEGLSYEVYCKDLRPSLDWSPVFGWTLPYKGSNRYHPCAQLVRPLNQDLTVRTLSEDRKEDVLVAAGSSLEHSISCASHISTGSEPSLEMSEQSTKQPAIGKKTRTSGEIFDKKSADPGVREQDETGNLKKMKTDEKICLNSTCSSTIEAAIVDLEELISRVKWIRGILDLGTPASDSSKSSWKFQEHRPSATPK